MKTTKQKNTVKTMLVVTVLVAMAVGYFIYLLNKPRREPEEEVTPVQEVLSRSLEREYPNTPKAVIRYYNEIMVCFYNEECSEEEIEQLALKARELYDQELIEHNNWDNHLAQLEAEISTYKASGGRISNMFVNSATDVDYFEEDGFSFARIGADYSLTADGETYPVNHIYLLRKDVNNHWKIYGWDTANHVQVN